MIPNLLRPRFSLPALIVFIWLGLLLSNCTTSNSDLFQVKLDQPLKNDDIYIETWKEFWQKTGVPKDAPLILAQASSPDNPFLTTFFHNDQFEIKAVSVRSADVETSRSKFRIALMDANQDGTYNQIGVDYLILSQFERDTIFMSVNSRQIVPIEKSTIFQVDKDYYQILYFDTKGLKIKFRRLASSEWDTPITGLTTSLPKFMVEDHEGEEIGLWKVKEKDKPLIIINWDYVNHRLDPKVQEINKLYLKIKDRYSVIGVNHWRDREDFLIFEQMNDIPFSTYHVKDKFYTYLIDSSHSRMLVSLFDKDHHILENGLSLEEFFEYVQAKNEKKM